jgi:nucleoside-diphosphate-sugar epimerase
MHCLNFYNALTAVSIARPFNTTTSASARAIIPTIISQIASGMKEIKVGDLTPRDFNYVKDSVADLLLLQIGKNIGKRLILQQIEISMEIR